ncbi:MAG: aminoglycoside phosphotransferase family protein [Advenella sp.]
MTSSMTDGKQGLGSAGQEPHAPTRAQATSDPPIDVFVPWMRKWGLRQDGAPIATQANWLLPVKIDNIAAMLKVTGDEHEIRGAGVLEWWQGHGAARIFFRSTNALVMERAQGERSLMHMALHGSDDQASQIACQTVAQLHANTLRASDRPELIPLHLWFDDLTEAAGNNPILRRCCSQAQRLLAEPQDIVVLHGDIHHDNILDFDARGWLAIDPKGLIGERGFDYANLIVNPDLPTAEDPIRFTRQVQVVSQAADLNHRRLLCWILAFAGLSAVWFTQDANDAQAQQNLNVARLAIQALSLNLD